MKIIVTGGAGFIGSNFVFYMMKKHPDYKIICLDKLTYAGNLSTLKDVMDKPNFRFVKLDICDREGVYKLFEEEHPDVVVNFAAESPVTLDNHQRRQVVLFKVDDFSTLALNQETLFPQYLDWFIHHLGTEGFTSEGVEVNVQHVINLLEPFQGNFSEPAPQALGFFIAVFQLGKPFPAVFIVFRVFFSFPVDSDIVRQKGVDWILFDVGVVAPHLVGSHHLPELGAPVTQVVDSDRLEAFLGQNAGNSFTDHG